MYICSVFSYLSDDFNFKVNKWMYMYMKSFMHEINYLWYILSRNMWLEVHIPIEKYYVHAFHSYVTTKRSHEVHTGEVARGAF
jgi:hypothetical protein